MQQRHRLTLARPVDVLHQGFDQPSWLLAAEQGRHRAEYHGGAAPPLEAEAQAQAACMETEDFARAYRAFQAKQTPKFEGN